MNIPHIHWLDCALRSPYCFQSVGGFSQALANFNRRRFGFGHSFLVTVAGSLLTIEIGLGASGLTPQAEDVTSGGTLELEARTSVEGKFYISKTF